MRPMLRHRSLLIVDSFIASTARSAPLPARKALFNPDVRPALCIRCRLRVQRRPFSDGKKPPPYAFSRDDREPSSRYVNNAAESTASLPQTPSSSSSSNDGTQHRQRQDLPSHEEERRSHVAKHFSHVMDNLQSNIFIAGKRLNDLTGYSGIEVMKKDIEEQEELVRNTRASLRAAKDSYSAAIAQRSASQREVNELLQRKHAWSPQDLERFTSLYRSDHANEQAEAAAQEALTLAERQAEEAAARLSKSILARYHEEQIWSDKIRRMSTWGTWGLMGVNVLLFLIFQIGVEPWRRKRLVKGFEEKVMEALEREGAAAGVMNHPTTDSPPQLTAHVGPEPVAERNETAIDNPPAAVAAAAPAPAPAATATADLQPEVLAADEAISSEPQSTDSPPPPQDPSPTVHSNVHSNLHSPPSTSTFEAYKSALQDLFSDRSITITQRDLTSVALEGAAAGMALVGLLVVLLRPR